MRYALFILFLVATSFGNSQSRLDKFESTYQDSKSLITSKDYTINFRMFYDDAIRKAVDPNSNYLSINQSTSKGVLKSLSKEKSKYDLSGNIENYEVNYYDDRKLINISYGLNRNGQNQNVELAIKPNGNVILSIEDDSNTSAKWIGKLVTKS